MVKKAEVGMDVIFYILMAIIFVGILIFGINKIFFVKNTISEQERVEITAKLKEALEYCEDPLNSGNFQNYDIKGGGFNSVCILSSNFDSSYPGYGSFDEFLIVKESGDNVILLETTFIVNEDSSYSLQEYNIIDTFKLSYEVEEVICWFDKDNDGKINIEVECD